MLKVILNRLKLHAREITAEEKTGFRAEWSTKGQNLDIYSYKDHVTKLAKRRFAERIMQPLENMMNS